MIKLITMVSILLLLPFSLIGSCTEGTLICTLNDQVPVPVLCDFQNSYILNEERTQCVKIPKENCKYMNYSESEPICFECDQGYYYDEQTEKCEKINISNCLESHLDGSCKRCKANYIIYENECIQRINIPEAITIHNCEFYNTETECQQCAQGFYLSDGVCREIPQVSLCRGYREVACLECEPGKFLKHSGYNEIFDNLDDFELSLFHQVVDFTRSSIFVRDKYIFSSCVNGEVPNCKEHEEIDKCKECDSGYEIQDNGNCKESSSARSARILAEEGSKKVLCNDFNAETDECRQCITDYQLIKNETLSTYEARFPNCKKVHGVFLRCEECLDNYYLDRTDNNTCKLRNLSGPEHNCSNPQKDRDVCFVCDPETVPVNQTLFTIDITVELAPQCMNPTKSNFQIPNCLIYSSDMETCRSCDFEYQISSDRKSCIKYNYVLTNYFDHFLNFVPKSTFPSISNCARYYQLDYHTVSCVECVENYVKIIDIRNVESNVLRLDLRYNSHTDARISIASKTCIHQQMSYSYRSPDPANSNLQSFNKYVENCDVGTFFHEVDTKFVCLRCRENYRGTVVLYDMPKDSIFKHGVGDCVPVEPLNIPSPLILQEFEHFNKGRLIPLSTYIEYTVCPDPQDLMLIRTSFDGYNYVFNESNYGQKVTECFKPNSFSDDHPLLNNCKIYAFNDQFKLQCVACDAGYQPDYDFTSNSISKCLFIPHCAPNSRYLNGCSNPLNGFLFNSESSREFSFINVSSKERVKELDEEKKKDEGECLVYTQFNQCMLCAGEYHLMEGTCKKPQFNATCFQEIKKSRTYLREGRNDNLFLLSYRIVMLDQVIMETKMKLSMCLSCPGNMIMTSSMNISLSDSVTCASGVENFSKQITGCEIYSVNPITCARCKGDLTFNEETNSCASYKTGCLSKNNQRCTKCNENMILSENGECRVPECEIFHNGQCYMCKDGFIFDKSNQECILPIQNKDECKAYSPVLRTCVKCKSGNLILVYDEEQDQFTQFMCATDLVDLTILEWEVYSTANLEDFIIIVNVIDEEFQSVSYSFLNLNNFLLHEVENQLTLESLNHCIRSRFVNNCDPHFYFGGFYCKRCFEPFSLDLINNNCIESNKPHCIINNSDLNCLECHPNFEISSRNNECLFNPDNQFCQDLNVSTKLCDQCNTGFVIDSFHRHCVPESNVIYHCKNYSENGECVECLSGFRLSNNSCLKCQNTECLRCDLYQNISNNTCVSCPNNYYFQLDKCFESTSSIQNCEVMASEGRCLACQNGFQLSINSDSCDIKAKLIKNCEVSLDGVICAECKSHFYPSTNRRSCLSNIINQCKFQLDENTCLRCNDKFMIEASTKKCVPGNIEDCKVYSPDGKCLECQGNYTLTSNQMQCIVNEIVGCEERGPNNTCEKCKEGYELSDDKTLCILKSIQFCQIPGPSNTCLQCIPGYKPTDDKLNCIEFQIDNCQELGSNGVCLECDIGYKGTSDRTKCNEFSIENCKDLGTEGICINCESGFIVSPDQKSCKELSPIVEIPNCKTKETDTTCAECEEGYELNADKTRCNEIPIVIGGCVNKGEDGNCNVCQKNYVLKIQEEDNQTKTVCVPSGINNCVQAVGGDDVVCLECASGYMPSRDLSQCVQPEPIDSCLEYATFDQCFKCRKNYIRSLDWKSCIPVATQKDRLMVQNCSNLVTLREVHCDQCHQGFYKKQTEKGPECLPCPKGCAACGMTNTQSNQIFRCFMCGLGFYMNSNYNCISLRNLE